MRITLQQIEAFIWAARLGSFHAAARHLNFTQPAISSRIKELESILGIEVFQRQHQRIELTPVGRHALRYAERLLEAGKTMETACQANPFEGLLRLGADESSGMAGLTLMLDRLQALFPELQVEVTIDNAAVLSQKLERRELDLALHSSLGEQPAADIVQHPIGQVPFHWIASTDLPLDSGRFTPAQAARLPIVARPFPSTSYGLIRKWMRAGGHEFTAHSRCNSLSLTLALVEAGHGIALVPASLIGQQAATRKIRGLQAHPAIAPASFGAYYPREAGSASLGRIIELIQATLVEVGYLTHTGARPCPPGSGENA